MAPDVILYGKPTLRFKEIKEEVKSLEFQLGFPIRVKEVYELGQIMSKGITEIPSITIGDKVIPCGKSIPKTQFINETASCLLQYSNYKSMKNILIPVDFTDESNNALEYGAQLSQFLNCQLQVLHVDHPSPVAAEGMVSMGYYEEEKKRKWLDTIVSQYHSQQQDSSKTSFQSEYAIGLAGDEIVNRSGDFDLIIMGSKRSNNSIMRWLGSVSNVVVRNSKCPVMIIPRDVNFKIPKKILFGYEPHPEAELHMAALMKFKENFGSELHISHINKSGDDPNLMHDLQQYMQHVFPDKQISYHAYDADTVEEGLLRKAKGMNADMICVAKTEKSIWNFMLHGNRSEALLGSSDRPLLVLNRIGH